GRRDQVVGAARVRDQPVTRLDLLHQRPPEPLRAAARDLARDRLRVDRLADVLSSPDPDDPGEPELDVDLGDHPHRRARVRDMRALAGRLPRLGAERGRSRMAGDPLDIDATPAAPAALLA